MRAVLERDFVAEGSGKRAFVARTLVGGTAAGVVVVAAIAAQRDEALDAIGAGAFRFLTLSLLVFLSLATPALLVASVLVERRQHTLGLLLASPVTVRGILLGKLLARVGTVGAWTAAALPPLGVLMLFGGTSLPHLANAAAALLGATVELAAWGLLVSCAARKMATGIVLGYLVPLSHWWLVESLRPRFPPGLGSALLSATTPVAGMADPAGWPGAGPGPGFAYLAFTLLLAVASLALSSVLLAREEEVRARLAPRVPHLAREDRFRRWLTRDNPVAWKESLLLDTAWSRFLYYLLLGLMVAGEGVFLWFDRRGEWKVEWNDGYVAACFTALAALASVLGAASMSFEKSRGTLDILRTTPLTPRQIVNGKLGGTAAGLLFLFLLPGAHLLLSCLRGQLSALAAIAMMLVGLLFVANYAVHGLAWGTVARTPFGAILGGASMILFGSLGCWLLCLLGPLLLFLSFSFSFQKRDSELPRKLIEILVLPAILGGSPLFVLLLVPTIFPGEVPRSWSDRVGFLPMGIFTLVTTPAFLVTRYGSLPTMLQRELVEMTRGEGVRPPLVPAPKAWRPIRWLRKDKEGPKP